ncbi:type III secretion system translocon subunit SctE [Pseudomonas zeae]|uniref:type III secretion system translocon subunit SctE n=1 Tax=Pseudomonas zeae TaxID=2745510 RepID=UPI0039DFE45A
MLIDSGWAPTADPITSPNRASARDVVSPIKELSPSISRLNMPSPGKSPVSQLDAMKALSRIMATVPQKQDGPTPMSLKELEKVPMDSILLASTLLSGEILGSTAFAKSKALAIMTDKQERIRQQEIRDCREEMDKSVAEQDKARKAGIFAAIFDWVIAAVEIVSGVLKIVGGVLTGNALTAVAGAMDLLAGLAGVVKATANTLALIDTDNAEKYREVAKTAGFVQLGFEIAGALVDVSSAARNMLVAKMIPQVTGTVLKSGADVAVVQAVKAGSKSALNQAAQTVGKEVAAQVAAQLASKLGAGASKALTKSAVEASIRHFGVNQLLKQLSQQSIEKMVTSAVKNVGQKAIEKGVTLSAKELSKQAVKAVWTEVIKTVAKSSTYIGIQSARAGLVTAKEVHSGVLNIEKANLTKEIQELMLDQQWLQALFALYKSEKEAALKRMGELVEGQSQVMEDGSKAIANAGAVQVQIAAAMV